MFLGSTSPWWYCQHIGDLSLQAQCLLQHLCQWPGHGCQDALKAVLEYHHQKLPTELKSHLQEMLHKISIYEKVIQYVSSYAFMCFCHFQLPASNSLSLAECYQLIQI
jgi:hypothetical protein